MVAAFSRRGFEYPWINRFLLPAYSAPCPLPPQMPQQAEVDKLFERRKEMELAHMESKQKRCTRSTRVVPLPRRP